MVSEIHYNVDSVLGIEHFVKLEADLNMNIYYNLIFWIGVRHIR